MKTETLYGIHPVHEALKARRRKIEAIFISDDSRPERFGRIRGMADEQGVAIQTTASDRILQMSRSRQHQGIAARVSPFPVVAVRSVAELAVSEVQPVFFLLLDQIHDPQNLGAIIRSALSVGVDAIIVPKSRSATPTPTVSKASAGALEHIHLYRVNNLAQIMQGLKKTGLWLYGLDGDSPNDLYRTEFDGSVGLVIGGEGSGLRRLVKTNCDQLLAIPQQGPIDSLNASAAAAVAMYEVFRQRRRRQEQSKPAVD